MRLPFDITHPLLAAAAWSTIAEPGNSIAGALVQNLGASEALAWLISAANNQCLSPVLGSGTAARHLSRAVASWVPRLEDLDPRRTVETLSRVGGHVLIPSDPRWPQRLHDLGTASPFSLWVRGSADLDVQTSRSVAMVGARAATAYGEHITMDITQDLCTRGFAVISGGAFGVDAAAHRAVLTQGGYTLAAMAGGVDRLYPAANHQMLRSVMESGGSVISEVPCGALPMKQRFLARNRVIACLASATVVVEAALRSGALSTANHATHLNRPVGAVPGPVTSMQSAGCHELIRSGAAMCVTEGAEVADLAGGMGVDAAPGKAGADATTDGLSQNELSVLDSFPARGSTTVTALARNGGVSVPGVLSALGVLETRGLVSACGSQWRRGK